jgi:hypothetical protein
MGETVCASEVQTKARCKISSNSQEIILRSASWVLVGKLRRFTSLAQHNLLWGRLSTLEEGIELGGGGQTDLLGRRKSATFDVLSLALFGLAQNTHCNKPYSEPRQIFQVTGCEKRMML